jgi:fatty acid desaturase
MSTADDSVQGPRDYAADEDTDSFVPEEPPSLAGTDPLTMLAWLGAVGGPVALLLSAMFWRTAPLLAILGIVAVFVLSVVFLIMKLPQEKDENDDGARV